MIKLNSNGVSFPVSAVLLDMDGVVTDSMPWHYKCWREVFRRHGVELDREDVYSREGEKGIISVMSIFKEKGIAFSIDEANVMLKEKEAMFRSMAQVNLFTGIEDFVRTIVTTGTRVALVTGTSAGEMKRLLTDAFRNFFSAIVTGDMLEVGKPNPEPYLKALELLCIKREGAVAVENAPLGIRSAKSAGLFTIAIETSLGAEFLSGADIVLPGHKGLYEIFMN